MEPSRSLGVIGAMGARLLVPLLSLGLALGLALGVAQSAIAAAPPANAVIGNQATATYTDASGQTSIATSNLVETIVQQVGSFTLTADNERSAAVGNTVYMPHVLTNLGNGTDAFTITLTDVPGTFEATGIALYLDADFDGLPDTLTPLCSGYPCNYTTAELPAGAATGFVLAMSVPGTAVGGQSDSVIVTATANTSSLYTTPAIDNTDTVTVTTGAAFQVSKAVSTSSGPTGTLLTYTLRYQNIGAATGNLGLQDVIGSGATAGFEYVPESAVWSAGATALSDAYTVGVPDATVGASEAHYQALTTGTETVIRATLTNIAPNITGTLTFQVLVLPTAEVGTATTSNTAEFGSDEDSDPTNTLLSQITNASTYDVQASRGVVFNDGTSMVDGDNLRPAPGDIDEPNNADLAYTASAAPGQTVLFDNYVWNTGTATDTFNITLTALGGPDWPAGTSFQLYRSDGASPLIDSNGDGIPDTGPVAPGESYRVVLRVALPANACDPTCPAGPFDVQKTAVSVADPSQSNVTFDRLGALLAPVVDLANSSGPVDATVNQDPVGPEPTTTLIAQPGEAVVFDLFVRNEGATADNYSLSYSASNFEAGTLPSGWTLQFRTAVGGVCAAQNGTVITNTGTVGAGAEVQVCAVATTAANALAGTTSIYFRALSQVTGASDVKHDAVTIAAVNRLILAPNNTGQVASGGTVVYTHTLSNTGNTMCGVTDAFTFDVNQSLQAEGWSFVLYHDVNGDGVIDAGDVALDPLVGLTGLTLNPGDEFALLVRVFAPASANPGSTDVVSLTATADCGGIATVSTSAANTTTVVSSQVRVLKTQAIDHNCDGTPSLPPGDTRTSGASYSSQPMMANPGECLLYRVVATNEGNSEVIELFLADTQPAFTDYSAGPTCSTGSGSYVAPTYQCSGATPEIQLLPAASATMEFRVRVQD